MKRLRPLRRLENRLERAVEGSVDRVFRPSIQPSEISRKLAREMADRQMVSVRGPIVPNVYVVSLHPDDFETFEGSELAIAQHIEGWLDDEADRLGFVTVGDIEVTLAPDPNCRSRSMTIQSSHRETTKNVQQPQSVPGQTEAFWIQPVRKPTTVVVLEVISGSRFGLAHQVQKAQTSIGRSLDNDWVIDSSDVSRHHAMIECHGEYCRIVDLKSLNGTFINHERISNWTPVYPGDLIGIGQVEVRLTHEWR